MLCESLCSRDHRYVRPGAARGRRPSRDAAASGRAATCRHAHAGTDRGQRYKNVQVLKDVPAEQLPLAMQYITASLGVGCDFCHVTGPGGAFDKDDKEPKQRAREMMKMMTAINTEQFEGRQTVGCMSCHNGRMRPCRTPGLAVEMTPRKRQLPGRVVADAAAPEAREVVPEDPGGPGGQRPGGPARQGGAARRVRRRAAGPPPAGGRGSAAAPGARGGPGTRRTRRQPPPHRDAGSGHREVSAGARRQGLHSPRRRRGC